MIKTRNTFHKYTLIKGHSLNEVTIAMCCDRISYFVKGGESLKIGLNDKIEIKILDSRNKQLRFHKPLRIKNNE